MKINDNANKGTIKSFIILVVAVGVGSFICDILEKTELNIWLARGIGSLITVITGLLIIYLWKRYF